MTELLAPAGNESCFLAAIDNGADAVYLGMSDFSARKNAENFNADNIGYYVSYAHLFGVKVYVAVNTLIKNNEFETLYNTVKAAYLAGADAFIVQDVFLGKKLKNFFPDILLHLSTQAGINNAEGAEFAKTYGFTRVILARETGIADIGKICKVCETEVFVHGALCSSFSGHCYMSSFIGGNSGNRGLCKQPCRKEYRLTGKNGGEYPISLADLCLIDELKTLEKAGVSSLKIEGRMRSPEYVAATVAAYRAALDGKPFSLDDVKATFHRGNFTKGYLRGADGSILSDLVQSHMGLPIGKISKAAKGALTVNGYMPEKGDAYKILHGGKEVGNAVCTDGKKIEYRGDAVAGDVLSLTKSESLAAKLLSVHKRKKIKVRAEIVAGEKIILSACGIRMSSPVSIEEAKTAATTEEEIRNNLCKTDRYPFEVACEIVIKGKPFVPKSVMNKLRSNFYEALFSCNVKQLKIKDYIEENKEFYMKPSFGNIVMTDRVNFDFINEDDLIVYSPANDRETNAEEVKAAAGKRKVYLFLPSFCPEEDAEQLKKLSTSFDGVYADGLWALSFAVSSGKPCVAGTGLNVFNDIDLEELSSLGIKDVVFSKELSLCEIGDRAETGYVFTRGNIGLMELIYCPFGKTCSSCKAKNEETLTDKTGHSFTVRRRKVNGKCRFLVENGLPLCSGKISHNFFDFVGFSETRERDFYGESDDAIKEKYSVTKGNLKRGVK